MKLTRSDGVLLCSVPFPFCLFVEDKQESGLLFKESQTGINPTKVIEDGGSSFTGIEGGQSMSTLMLTEQQNSSRHARTGQGTYTYIR